MCGFGFTNRSLDVLDSVSQFCRRRGPDHTTIVKKNGYTLFHHLLSVTGRFTPQPFYDESEGIFCVFNGEIYNYKALGGGCSDGEILIPAYLEYGPRFVRHLDGEFAILLIDFTKDLLVLSTDVFATKPMWLAIESDEIGVASYSSVLTGLGFQQPSKIPANTISVYDLGELRLKQKDRAFDFDLTQYKSTYDDWISAFEVSIRKRSVNTGKRIFLGLSSGYDSGAIALGLGRRKVEFKAYSIVSNENTSVLRERHEMLHDSELIHLTTSQYQHALGHLQEKAEDFTFDDYSVRADQGAVGLSHICGVARNEGYIIYLSGQGSDEIISDYGFRGRRIYGESGFGGVFPRDLAEIFPYRNFFDGSQVKWIYKEESVAGSYGIETRYPFLDKALVQEYLWLNMELKNRRYKAPIAEYFDTYGYPFEEGRKLGFSAQQNLAQA